jgi:23S rRNA-/tRNA-specific pseudouridylate synthase
VIVFGKSRLANGSLTRQFARHEVFKIYEFLTGSGGPAAPVEATAPIYEPGALSRGAGRPKEARTRFATLGERGGLVLVEARPFTGRTHQIRKHAALMGWPVLGDPVHAAPAGQSGREGPPWPHLLLHARELALVHPGDGRSLTIVAPRPRVFEAVWNGERDPAVLAVLARVDLEVLGAGRVSLGGHV